jgi:hypothetical protein
VIALALATVGSFSAAWHGNDTSGVAGSVRPRTAAEDTVSAMLREAARTGTLSGLRWPRFPMLS